MGNQQNRGNRPGRPPAGDEPKTAIAKREAPDRSLATTADSVEALQENLGELKAKGYRVLAPMVAVPSIPPMAQVSFVPVRIDPTVDQKGVGRECYRNPAWCKENELAYGKIALQKLANAAGLQVVESKRVDDRTDPDFWEWEVTVEGQDLDGFPRRVTARKEVDLREGRPETMKPEWVNEGGRKRKTGRQVPIDDTALAQKRLHAASNAETKAKLKAIREFFDLPHAEKIEEIRKPIVIPRLVGKLDESDPDVKAALIQKRVFGSKVLHAGALPAAPGTRETHYLETKPVDEEPQAAPGGWCDFHGIAFDGDCPECARDAGGDRRGETIDVEAETDDDFDPPEEEDAGPRCGCPCGCKVAPDEAQAARSKEKVGAVRCGACYPGGDYDAERHAGLEKLDLPKFPAATPAWAARQSAKRKGARR